MDIDVDEVLELVEQVLLFRQLSPTEQFVLHQSWYGRTYNEMAQQCSYASVYIKEIGNKLWRDLSKVLGQRVTKKNLRFIIEKHRQNYRDRNKISLQNLQINGEAGHAYCEVPNTKIELPGEALALDSPLYINRPPLEEITYAKISEPGSIIIIKAPIKMGKSSLVNRVIAHAKTQGYATVYLDIREADGWVFTDLDKFLRWLCFNVSRQLKLQPVVDDYWDEDMGSKVSCKLYFEGYILQQLHVPLVLALNKLNCVFEYPSIAQDFLSMLRFWHEQARQVESWQKLRLILVQTTEIYVPLRLNQSPFNVGQSIWLPPFTLQQAQELAQRYGLDWASGEEGAKRLAPLVEMVGGHPFLVSVALYHLYQQVLDLAELLQSAPTQDGIYSNYLQSLLTLLRNEAELASAWQRVVTSQSAVELEPITAHKLESLGLIKLDENQAKPSCELYRLYFLQHSVELKGFDTHIIQREKEEQEFQDLGNININNENKPIQLATQDYLKNYLKKTWQQWTREMTVLSLILCEVDYFKFYVDAFGQQAGDDCIQQIASTINTCVRHQAILTVRFAATKFAALMPHTDAIVAVEIAELIRQQVKARGITHDQSKVGGFPSQFVTVSIGVASTTPNPQGFAGGSSGNFLEQAQSAPEMLIAAAESALLESKRSGRDRVTLRQ